MALIWAVSNVRAQLKGKDMTVANMKLLGVGEVTELIGVFCSYVYWVILRLNNELLEAGCYVVHGRVNRVYPGQRCFGIFRRRGQGVCSRMIAVTFDSGLSVLNAKTC